MRERPFSCAIEAAVFMFCNDVAAHVDVFLLTFLRMFMFLTTLLRMFMFFNDVSAHVDVF